MNKALLFSLLISLSFSGALLAMEITNENNNDNASQMSDLEVLQELFDEQGISSDQKVEAFFDHFGLNQSDYKTKIIDTFNRLEILPSEPGIPYVSSFYPSQRKLGSVATTLTQLADNEVANIYYSISWESPSPDTTLWQLPAIIKGLFTYSLKIDKKARNH